MNIAIIGTGNVGSALARSFARAGHNVTLAARDAEKTQRVAAETGATAAPDVAAAARDADVVVLAVWYANEPEVTEQLRPVAAGKVVVETSNPLTPDYSGIETAGGPSAAERLAERLPEARIVKAFNTVFSPVQADPQVHGQPVDALFATDDEEARKSFAALVASAGFRPVYAGPLVRARELESLGFLNIALQMQHDGDWRSAFAVVGAPESAVAVPDRVAA